MEPIVMKTMVDFGNDGDGSGYDGVQLGTSMQESIGF